MDELDERDKLEERMRKIYYTSCMWYTLKYNKGGGQKNQKLNWILALYVFPFYCLHWLQKYKDEPWTPMGSAYPRVVIFQ